MGRVTELCGLLPAATVEAIEVASQRYPPKVSAILDPNEDTRQAFGRASRGRTMTTMHLVDAVPGAHGRPPGVARLGAGLGAAA